MTSRRSVLKGTAAVLASQAGPQLSRAQSAPHSVFFDLLRTPDYAAAYGSNGLVSLVRSGDKWEARGISLKTTRRNSGLSLSLSSPGVEPVRLHCRWRFDTMGHPMILGDAWERSYGELGWRSVVPERVMPWYFLTHQNDTLHAYGVKTGAAALPFWQLDQQGISLWLDTSNGGSGVQLRDRVLELAQVVTRQGQAGQPPMEAATAFCRLLCSKPKLLHTPIYGTNDWYYCYGKNSAEQTLRDAELVAELAPSHPARPFAVIDMGWKDGSPTFPSMPDLASRIKGKGVRPGLWIRPLEGDKDAPSKLLLPAARFGKRTERGHELAYDPTIPEALQVVLEKVKAPVQWGYELIKHDFSTYDLLGKWGSEMGPEPTVGGWHLNDRTRTNAEVICALYQSLRAAAGEQTVLIGCNTMGHLGAGYFESQRTGDDTSGRQWERTRRMGVNTVAFRLPQHNTFFAMDPDCVGITPAIPWEMNRQWLDLLAKTGVALFISPDPKAMGSEERAAVKEAFALAVSEKTRAVPENWLRDTTPDTWLAGAQQIRYRWTDASGTDPFPI